MIFDVAVQMATTAPEAIRCVTLTSFSLVARLLMEKPHSVKGPVKHATFSSGCGGFLLIFPDVSGEASSLNHLDHNKDAIL
jgi:hypothetical protein